MVVARLRLRVRHVAADVDDRLAADDRDDLSAAGRAREGELDRNLDLRASLHEAESRLRGERLVERRRVAGLEGGEERVPLGSRQHPVEGDRHGSRVKLAVGRLHLGPGRPGLLGVRRAGGEDREGEAESGRTKQEAQSHRYLRVADLTTAPGRRGASRESARSSRSGHGSSTGLQLLSGLKRSIARNCLERLRPEVLLVDDAVVADDEGLHAGHLVVRRRRDEREAADHRALHDEVHLARAAPPGPGPSGP